MSETTRQDEALRSPSRSLSSSSQPSPSTYPPPTPNSDSDSSSSPPACSPVMKLMAGRMATSPKSKAQMMKDNARKNLDRKSKEKKQTLTLEEQWEKVNQAGCTFYVNRFTGEAQEDNPFDTSAKKFDELKIVEARIKEDVSPPLATGYGCYEELRPEFERVMAFLDGRSKTYE